MNDFGDDAGDEVLDHVGALLALCKEKNVTIATAESCTGGLIAATLTEVAGSSAMVDRGFVTYSNEAKTDMLGVPPDMIERYGAVSSEVASAMAEGALSRANADVTIAVTGIAGPDGGTDLKPVGLVWFSCSAGWAPTFVHKAVFPDHGRAFIRHATVMTAIEILTETVKLAPEVPPVD
ncbi:CinA family protein [Oricola nitratireducens]|uniref:CinA family protein n=1 Tax=Oricola nitratireducens TaxID=2775868 RepID=UPI0018687D7C|nr:CinA family protein [Oricola nitratireducens]